MPTIDETNSNIDVESDVESNQQLKTDRRPTMRCRVCGCTERHACVGGCSWMPGEGNLCTTCGDLKRHGMLWKASAWRPNPGAMWREMRRAFRMLEEAQRTVAARGGEE